MHPMKTWALWGLIGLSMSGCGFINGLFNRGDEADVAEQEEVGEAPELSEDGATGEDADQLTEETSEDGLFQEAILPGLPSASEIALAELLPSTDPDERLREIERERSDPYSYVPVPPPPSQAPPPEDTPGSGATGDGTAQDPPGLSEPPGFLPTEPPEPVAVIASQVAVSGIVRANGEAFAIVKAPGEPSRHVRVGDRLSRGVVLVKRIEDRPGREPVVVLEERGVEVTLAVGSGPEDAGTSTAFQPNPPSAEVATLPFLPSRN